MRVLQHRRQSGSRRDAVVARALRALPRLPRPCAFVAGTAAWLHGVDVLPPGVDERVWPLQAALTRRPPTLVLDVEPRYWRIDAVDVCVVDGLPTTTPERTL
ncbi:MAG: hypothetical protein ACRDXX_06305, partial [Stackebrandtia sp.]